MSFRCSLLPLKGPNIRTRCAQVKSPLKLFPNIKSYNVRLIRSVSHPFHFHFSNLSLLPSQKPILSFHVIENEILNEYIWCVEESLICVDLGAHRNTAVSSIIDTPPHHHLHQRPNPSWRRMIDEGRITS
mgnify:CR=1 FL=1